MGNALLRRVKLNLATEAYKVRGRWPHCAAAPFAPTPPWSGLRPDTPCDLNHCDRSAPPFGGLSQSVPSIPATRDSARHPVFSIARYPHSGGRRGGCARHWVALRHGARLAEDGCMTHRVIHPWRARKTGHHPHPGQPPRLRRVREAQQANLARRRMGQAGQPVPKAPPKGST